MTGPLLHWPALNDLGMSLLSIVGVLLIQLEVAYLCYKRWIVAWETLLKLGILYLIMDCSRMDLRRIEGWVALLWFCIGRNLPWNRWKKQAGKKLSSLTEVAKAALQRQTAEAFSS